ncbi:MAG: heme o synthase [Akkermansiaceae bacterium]|jgi:protoheme IX farnesyltransferase|nr:heme o synthase [Akkermansiaceae bacterium]
MNPQPESRDDAEPVAIPATGDEAAPTSADVESDVAASAGSGEDEVAAAAVKPGLRKDLMVLVKLRLNVFVLITTFFGFLLASKGGEISWWLLLHTLVGTALAAFGSAAFNQLMEVDLDARMKRTADRPLPARRMDPLFAFGVGWMLSAAGIIHLAVKVGALSAILAAVTVAVYVFIYTPMKRWSSVNTLVGAIPGAIPPVIGWVAVPGHGLDGGAAFLFSLLFLWQLPHFVAISWLCREEYEVAGYRMWSNGDISGKKSGMLSAIFSLMLAALPLWPWWAGYTPGFSGHLVMAVGVLLGLAMAALSGRFMRDGLRTSFRRLFFFTLLYLPIELGCLAFAWR